MRYQPKDYSKSQRQEQHPVWRGIGFLLLVIVPVLSYGLAELLLAYLLENVEGFAVPPMLKTAPFALTPTWVVEDVWAVLLLAILIMVVLFSLLSFINTYIFFFSHDRKTDVFEADIKSLRKEFNKKKRK